MNLKLLIDGVVRQTTLLIAQISTASGVRAPLAHVADQVFMELAREIEAQGVRRQVVADMFGLALRSYQKKMRRLTESATERERTLWTSVLELVEREQPSKKRLFERFERDGEREVAAVLKDLVRSGLVSVTGTGNQALYSATTQAVRERLKQESDLESLTNFAWLGIFRREVTTRGGLAEFLGVDAVVAARALEDLLASGRVSEHEGELESVNLVVPVGAEQGWETAVLDHFRAVSVAIASKIRAGFTASAASDRVGGSTFTFTVAEGHPHEAEVYQLLARVRADVQALWDRVAAHNREHPPDPEASARVTFYLGQAVQGVEE